MDFMKDRVNVSRSCTCGDRLKAGKILFSLVFNFFRIHRFVNHFFGFSIIVQNNRMIQVASCKRATIKRNRKPFQNHQSKTMFLFKTYTLEIELTSRARG